MNLEEIKLLHQAGHFEQAKQAYLTYINSHPNDPIALHLYALLLVELGDLSLAQQYLEQAIQLDQAEPTYQLHLANVLKAQGLLDNGITLLEALIAKNPNLVAAFNNLGTLYYEQKNWQQAIAAYQEALRLQPNYIDAYYNLGLALTKAKQYESAQNVYQALLELVANHPGGLFQLGCLAMQKADYLAALKHFSILEESYPLHFETQTNIATSLLRLGRLEEAKMHYLKALQLMPDDTQLLFNLGVVCLQQGRIDEALTFYLQALKIDPNLFDVHNNLAVLYLMIRDPQKALMHFQEALRIQPGNKAIMHSINILTQSKQIIGTPPEYIASLFDSYADHFDQHLASLQYQVPQLIQQAVIDVIKTSDLNILDLGCGSGLCAEQLKPIAMHLVGVDLSAKMLEIAHKKKLYDELIQSDVLAYLKEKQNQFDLIIAGDVIVYFGELDILFALIARALKQNAYFIFNVEEGEKDFQMNAFGRFEHAKTYLDTIAHDNHFTIVQSNQVTLRTQSNIPVKGYLYVLKKE